MRKTDAAIKNYTDGRIPHPEILVEVSELTGCSIHWLLTGNGPKWIIPPGEPGADTPIYFGAAERKIICNLASQCGRSYDDEVRQLVFESLLARGLVSEDVDSVVLEFFGDRIPKLVPMHLYGEIAAGEPIDVVTGDEMVMIAEDFKSRSRDTFVLRVRGDSMIDEGIMDRDLLICVKADSATNGDKVVALIDGEKATVKKFYHEHGRVRLQPANPHHNPSFFDLERVKIQAVVIGIQRRA